MNMSKHRDLFGFCCRTNNTGICSHSCLCFRCFFRNNPVIPSMFCFTTFLCFVTTSCRVPMVSIIACPFQFKCVFMVQHRNRIDFRFTASVTGIFFYSFRRLSRCGNNNTRIPVVFTFIPYLLTSRAGMPMVSAIIRPFIQKRMTMLLTCRIIRFSIRRLWFVPIQIASTESHHNRYD